MNILIGSDMCATENNNELFEKGDLEGLVGKELKEKLLSADGRIFNLETPIINESYELEKCGVHLRMSLETINLLKKLNISLLTLANNHIMDHGIEGYKSTINALNEADIAYVGVGDNLSSLCKDYIIDIKGKKIGFYACAEHEFSIADQFNPGANPYDPLNTFDDIFELKKKCDYLVVLYHGGKEFYNYVSPEIQKIFRKMADKGADLVISQHTHCIGCFEEYNNSTLVYGQGNFIFDSHNAEFAKTSLLINVIFENEQPQVEFVPVIKNDDGTIRIADQSESEKILNDFKMRSEQIKDNKFLEDAYRRYVLTQYEMYLNILHGSDILFRIINKLIGRGLIFKVYNKRKKKALLNLIECEAHRELVITALKTKEK